MARKICTETGCTRPQSTDVIGPTLCDPHLDFYSWQNTHDDQSHDDPENSSCLELADEMEACPICQGVDPATLNPKAGTTRKDQAKTAHRSHATCEHPRTPAGRAACRKAGGPTPKA